MMTRQDNHNNNLRLSLFFYVVAWLVHVDLAVAADSTSMLIWSEEFDYVGPPNPEIWQYDLGTGVEGWGNLELQHYTDDETNVKVENGALHIIAHREDDVDSVDGMITSARIKTLDQVAIQYGTIEASIKFPNMANGLWPAFWLLGQDFPLAGWPQCGELDIMEGGSAEGIAKNVVNRYVGSAAHWYDPANAFSGGHATYGLYKETPNDLNDGQYHILKMNWTPAVVETFVDDSLIWRMDIAPLPVFQSRSFFILLNMAVGGRYTGILNPEEITATFPAELAIDYIRVYANEHTVIEGNSTTIQARTFPELQAMTASTNGDTTTSSSHNHIAVAAALTSFAMSLFLFVSTINVM